MSRRPDPAECFRTETTEANGTWTQEGSAARGHPGLPSKNMPEIKNSSQRPQWKNRTEGRNTGRWERKGRGRRPEGKAL